MKVSPEILAMLNPHAQSHQHVAAAFERITMEDVVHALARVKDEAPRLMGRVKYAQQDMFLQPLMNLYWPHALDVCRRRKWRVQPEKLRSLAFFTLYEYVRPPRCTKCKGRGSTRLRLVKGEESNPDDPLTCPRCKGSTFEPIRNADYARALKMSEVAWKENNWMGKQREIRAPLEGWEITCLAEMLDFIDPQDNA